MATPQFVKRMLGVRLMAKLTGADGGESPEEIFTSYYHKNFWGDDQSRSGPGSNDVETHVIRERLPGLLKEMGATSILDIPCGDFDWMRKVDLGDVSYLGADIVQPLIDRNIAMFGSPRIAFVKLDLIEDRLPRRDVVLCRDCLFHLSLTDGVKALANIRKSGARYLMATTHPSNLSNSDSRNGGYRPLDLTKWPFDLPAPHELIPERPHADHADRNKSIGIWKLNDIGA